MTTTIEQVQALGRRMADISKINLTQAGELTPVIFLITDGKILDVVGVMEIAKDQEKRHAYRTLAVWIRQRKPDAVILINDAYAKSFPKEKIAQAFNDYENGNYATDPEATECIVVSFKGPSIPTHVLHMPYHRSDTGDIVFDGKEEWASEAEINLLPDW